MMGVVDLNLSYKPVGGIFSICIITEIASAEGLIIFVLYISNNF